ncbi:SSS family solute/sodium (Na+) symporter [Palleronia sediminis]|uniref:SSS family solute/sodium (Na+) symporter n=1 Tax=Palleronia sediminis TaxID=2547833 RepID=A0A4R6A1Q1_9RHOB|nr:sodium:solute symporter [Palleronia sediminis]TDL76347.1 SSS family solute/sodium (Na+) symporter [Palleronia sediminis]
MEQEASQGLADAIHLIDWLVIAGYFAVVIGIGIWVSRRTKSGEDLFLAGRALTWGIIGFSLFASNISSTTLIGLTGAAYQTGIAASAYEWMAGVPLILLAFIFAPVFLRSRITTIPEYLELRYDRKSRLYFSAITIILTIVVDTAGGLYAGAVVVRVFLPDASIWMTCVAIGLFAGLYTAGGGLRAVVLTDVLQAVVLIVGSAAMTAILFSMNDWSWATVKESVPEGQLSIVQPRSDDILPWPGLIFGVPLLGFWYWVTNQYIVQRVLGAKTLRDAQNGAILAGFLKILPMFIMVLPGAMAIGILPNLENADKVFPTLVSEVLPVGLTGLVLAGLVAAIMSSVDSTLNSASTLIVHDFVRNDKRDLDPSTERKYGRITTIVLMLIAIAWAPLIAQAGGLWSYLQQAFSILVPPVIAVFTLGALWRGATATGAFTALLTGHAFALGTFILTQMGIWPLHFTVNIGVMTILSTVVLVVVSLMTDRKDTEQLDKTVWRRAWIDENAEDGATLSKLLIWSGLLVAAMTFIMIAFW